MTSPWRLAARAAIQNAIFSCPENCDRSQIKKAIDAAYPFGERRYHPYKIWLDERRAAFYELGLISDPPKNLKIKKPPTNPDGVVDGQLSLF